MYYNRRSRMARAWCQKDDNLDGLLRNKFSSSCRRELVVDYVSLLGGSKSGRFPFEVCLKLGIFIPTIWTKIKVFVIQVPIAVPSTIVPNPRSKKWSKWKMNTTFALETFKIMKLSCLVKKFFSLKKNRTLVFVFFHICNHINVFGFSGCDYRYEKRQA